jgi:predicted transcriptional regulator
MPRGDGEPSRQVPTTLAGFSFVTMSFDPTWIRQAIYSREWTPEEFAVAADPPLSVETVYNVIKGGRLRPATVQRVYKTLRKRQPQPVTE